MRRFVALTLFACASLMGLSMAWWAWLLSEQAKVIRLMEKQLASLGSSVPHAWGKESFLTMLFWEGSALLGLLLALVGVAFVLELRDQNARAR